MAQGRGAARSAVSSVSGRRHPSLHLGHLQGLRLRGGMGVVYQAEQIAQP
jgi:hypothetical protein